jgi:hypothetical protein
MQPDRNQNRPSLLMLSDSFPDMDGSSRAARAWRLLGCAAATHEVYLSAVADRPVNLRLWRRVAQLTHRVHIASSSWRRATPLPFSGEAVSWTQQREFDAMLATSPSAWPGDDSIRTGLRLCDFASSIDNLQRIDSEAPGRLASIFRLAMRRGTDRVTPAEVRSACDRLLVASDQQAQMFRDDRSKAVILGDTDALVVWSKLFAEAEATELGTPTLTVLAVQPVHIKQAA